MTTPRGERDRDYVDQRRVVFVIFDGFQPLDLTGPREVFHCAENLAGGYCCQIVATRPGPVRSPSGLWVHAEHGVADLDPGGIDTLVVTGGAGVGKACQDPALTRWIAAAGAQRALTETDDPVATIARRYGFGTAETLRRAFHRNISVAPSDYRDRFRSTREQA